MSASAPTPFTIEGFRKEHPLEKRKAEADRIRAKYMDRIPIVVGKAPKSDIPEIDKHKFLCPHDLTVGQMNYVIRKRIKLPADSAIFLFCNNTLPPAGALLSQIYKEHASDDHFLYLTYSGT